MAAPSGCLWPTALAVSPDTWSSPLPVLRGRGRRMARPNQPKLTYLMVAPQITTPRSPSKTDEMPSFISRQVVDGEYYFLNLEPSPQADLIVTCGGKEHCSQDYRVQRDRFDYYGIEFIAAGECDLMLDGKAYPLRPGAIFCYGPNTSHQIARSSNGPLLKYFVDLKGRQVPDLLWETFLENGKPHQIVEHRWIHDIFKQLHDSGKRGGDNVQEVSKLLVRLLVERLRQLSSLCEGDHGMAYATYERCRAYLESNYCSLKSVNDCASECFVSSAYMARLFKRFANTSPQRVLNQCKMNYAARLLSHENLMVKDVADRIGYEDPCYFSKAFKQFFGVSPKHIARTALR